MPRTRIVPFRYIQYKGRRRSLYSTMKGDYVVIDDRRIYLKKIKDGYRKIKETRIY